MSKLLFLSPNLCSGGAERQLVTVACLLKNRGHDVTVYCYDKADFYASILNAASVPIVWDITTNYILRILKVRKLIRRGGFDAVVSFQQTPNFLNCIAALGGKKWKVVTGERSSRDFFFSTIKGRLFSWFQRYSDLLVCNSQNAKQMWIRHYPQYTNKLHVIYNTVTLGNVNSEYIPKRDGKLHVVVAATYQFLKNPLGLAEALQKMKEEERSKLVVDWYGRKAISIGDSRAYDEVKKIVEDNGLTGVFVLHEETKDIANIMYQADVVMLLSQFEGLPNVICEAMSLGKPIIMTRVSDYNILVNQYNGILCDWNNTDSIKDGLINMSSIDISKLTKMGACSKRKAETLFSEKVVVDAWEKILNVS